MQVACLACGIQLHVEHLLGNRAAVAILEHARILNGVLQIEEHARRRAGVTLVNEYRAAPQKVAMAVERQIKRGIEQRMAGANEGGERLALRCDQGFLKGDALVARQHRFARSDQAVAVAYRRGNMGDFIAARLALARRAAELTECFEEE